MDKCNYGYMEKNVTFRVQIMTDDTTMTHGFVSLDNARHVFKTCSKQYDTVVLEMYNNGQFVQILDTTVGIKPGRDVNHTGFCMGTFNTGKCYDCPSLTECITLMMRDKAIKVVEEMEEVKNHG